MKPKIIYWRHPDGRAGWRCWSYPAAIFAGIGRTPKAAYNGWLAAMKVEAKRREWQQGLAK